MSAKNASAWLMLATTARPNNVKRTCTTCLIGTFAQRSTPGSAWILEFAQTHRMTVVLWRTEQIDAFLEQTQIRLQLLCLKATFVWTRRTVIAPSGNHVLPHSIQKYSSNHPASYFLRKEWWRIRAATRRSTYQSLGNLRASIQLYTSSSVQWRTKVTSSP